MNNTKELIDSLNRCLVNVLNNDGHGMMRIFEHPQNIMSYKEILLTREEVLGVLKKKIEDLESTDEYQEYNNSLPMSKRIK